MLKNYKKFILEKRDLTKKVKKFANVPSIYKWANELDSDQAIWLSNCIVSILKDTNNDNNNYLKKIKGKDKKLEQFLKTGKSEDNEFNETILKAIKWAQSYYKDKFVEVLHYVNSPIHRNKPNINKLSLEDALETSKKWHNEIEKLVGEPIRDESGEVIMEFEDGFYWIDLESTTCESEAESMGHCGNTNQGTTILSLRDEDKRPHVTIAYDENGEIFTQIKGKGNTKPVEKYHEYIVDLIIDLNVQKFSSEYERSSDLLPEDLSEELYDKLNDANPEYVKSAEPKTIEELKELYREDMSNNGVEEEITFNPYAFWRHVDDGAFINNFLENEVSSREFKGEFDEEELIAWIKKDVDIDKLKKYLVSYVEKWLEEDDEDTIKEKNEKLEAIEDDPYEFMEDDGDFDQSLLEDMVEDLSDVSDFMRDYLERWYIDYDASDIYRDWYGDPYKELDYKTLEWFLQYFNEDNFIDEYVEDEQEENLRDRYE